MKTAKTIAKLYSRTELTAALCDAVANRQASEQARQDAEAALTDVRARLHNLRDQIPALIDKTSYVNGGLTSLEVRGLKNDIAQLFLSEES